VRAICTHCARFAPAAAAPIASMKSGSVPASSGSSSIAALCVVKRPVCMLISVPPIASVLRTRYSLYVAGGLSRRRRARQSASSASGSQQPTYDAIGSSTHGRAAIAVSCADHCSGASGESDCAPLVDVTSCTTR
jgi:hypothetical protein